MAAELIQIYYDDSQIKACYPFSRLYFNDSLTIFFENTPIKELVLASDKDKVGICSWKLRQKMKYNIRRPRELTREVLESDYEVLSFTSNTKYHGMLFSANHWHEGFKETLQLLANKVGFLVPKEVKTPIYQNAFMAKREIYQDYVKNWLSPAMEYMTNDSELNKMVMVDSKYSTLNREGSVTSDYLFQKIGVGYYPLAPFILERLFSIYVHNNKINVTWL